MKEFRHALIGRRAFGGLAAGLGLTLALTACSGGSDPLTPAPAASGSGSPSPSGPAFVVGSTDLPESQVIAEIYAGALNAAGIPASAKPGTGSRDVYLKAVQDGAVDIFPDYSGQLLLHMDQKAAEVSADDVTKAVQEKLPDDLAVLEAAKAEDKDVLVVTTATAEKHQLKSIEDLAKVCSELVLGATATFATRSDGLPGLKEKYDCVPKKLEPFSDGGGPLTVKALLEDNVQVAGLSTTSPAISDNDLVILEDTKNNFIAQQVLPLFNKNRMTDRAKDALNAVSRTLTTEDLVNLNRAVSANQKQAPKDAAEAWLRDKGIVK